MTTSPLETTTSSTIGTTTPSTVGAISTTTLQPILEDAQVTSESLSLPESLTTAAEGLVLSGHQLTEEGGFEILEGPWIATIDNGEPQRIVAEDCYWDGWYLTPPHPLGADGIIVSNGEGIVLCAPGREVRTMPGRAGLMGVAEIEGERQGILATPDGLALLSLRDLDTRLLADLDLDQRSLTAASYGGSRFLVVFESEEGPIQDRIRSLMLLDDAGEEMSLALPTFGEGNDPHLAAAAISTDGTRLWLAEEFSDGSTDLVHWDLDLAEELARIRVIDAFVPGDDPYGFGREYVRYVDTSGGRVLLGLATVEAENYLSGVLIVEPDGTLRDLSDVEGIGVIAASFND